MKEKGKPVKEQLIADNMRRCVHFNGVMNRACEAGVVYEEVANTGELYPHRLPCLRESRNDCCQQREFRTRGEAELEAERGEAAMQRSLYLMAAVIEKVGNAPGREENGIIACPTCKAPARYVVSAYNGHVKAACSRSGCCSFIQ